MVSNGIRCLSAKLSGPYRARGCKVSKANDKQQGGNHYKRKAIQPWDYIAANEIGFFEGSAIKYLTRWRDKGGIEDLRKANHFIEKLIELEVEKIRNFKK